MAARFVPGARRGKIPMGAQPGAGPVGRSLFCLSRVHRFCTHGANKAGGFGGKPGKTGQSGAGAGGGSAPGGGGFFLLFSGCWWRRRWDSNPRTVARYSLSRGCGLTVNRLINQAYLTPGNASAPILHAPAPNAPGRACFNGPSGRKKRHRENENCALQSRAGPLAELVSPRWPVVCVSAHCGLGVCVF